MNVSFRKRERYESEILRGGERGREKGGGGGEIRV